MPRRRKPTLNEVLADFDRLTPAERAAFHAARSVAKTPDALKAVKTLPEGRAKDCLLEHLFTPSQWRLYTFLRGKGGTVEEEEVLRHLWPQECRWLKAGTKLDPRYVAELERKAFAMMDFDEAPPPDEPAVRTAPRKPLNGRLRYLIHQTNNALLSCDMRQRIRLKSGTLTLSRPGKIG
jgi:hypothetical protein